MLASCIDNQYYVTNTTDNTTFYLHSTQRQPQQQQPQQASAISALTLDNEPSHMRQRPFCDYKGSGAAPRLTQVTQQRHGVQLLISRAVAQEAQHRRQDLVQQHCHIITHLQTAQARLVRYGCLPALLAL